MRCNTSPQARAICNVPAYPLVLPCTGLRPQREIRAIHQHTIQSSSSLHDVTASPPVKSPNLVSNRAASSAVVAGTNPRSTNRDDVSGVAFHPLAVWKKIIDNRSWTGPLYDLVSCGHLPSNAQSSPVEAIGTSTASDGDKVAKSRLLPDGQSHKRSEGRAILRITLGPWLFAST